MAKKLIKRAKQDLKPLAETKSTKIFLFVLLALSYIIYLSWALSSNSTWDDDCATRYFRTLNAFLDPREFISLWNRPLFVLVFSIPVAIIGKLAIPLIMSLISVTAAYFLYQSARLSHNKYALLIVPFLLFQPFFFGTGRDAMTEPMAAAIISIGLYASLKKRWLLFAILGAIIPLARTELTLLLPIWAFILFKEKQYKYIPVLGLGLLLWNTAGWIIDGNALFIFKQTIDKADEANRYGSQKFFTYFNRYLYVVGPVVFYFFLLGLINKIKKLDVKPLVLIQFAAGFMVYTLLAWKITIGQSAGFLRNLIPLSPLAAFIALDGFEYITDSIKSGKNRIWLMLLCLILAVLIIALYPYQIEMHHTISKSKKFDYLNASVIGSLGLLLSLAILLHQWIRQKYLLVLAILTGAATLGYALYTEPPRANMNSEREMMTNVASCYKACGLEAAPRTLCAHLWFHWAGGYIPFRPGSKFIGMSKDSLNKAPYGSVIIWENHYSNRLGSNIQLADLSDPDKYCLLATFYPKDGTKVAFMYIKKDPNKTPKQYLDEMINKNPYTPELYVQRSTIYQWMNDNTNAKQDLDRATRLAPTNNIVKLSYGSFYLSTGNSKEAIRVTDEVIKSNTEFTNAYLIKGNAFFSLGDYLTAIKNYNEILSRVKDNKEANFNIGVSYIRMGKFDEACKFLTEAKRLKMPNADSMVAQYCNKLTPQTIGTKMSTINTN